MDESRQRRRNSRGLIRWKKNFLKNVFFWLRDSVKTKEKSIRGYVNALFYFAINRHAWRSFKRPIRSTVARPSYRPLPRRDDFEMAQSSGQYTLAHPQWPWGCPGEERGFQGRRFSKLAPSLQVLLNVSFGRYCVTPLIRQDRRGTASLNII